MKIAFDPATFAKIDAMNNDYMTVEDNTPDPPAIARSRTAATSQRRMADPSARQLSDPGKPVWVRK